MADSDTKAAQAAVELRLPDGSLRALTVGAIIGRLATADLHLEAPHISEAHALVSLRGAELKLLALRGRLGVAGRPVPEVTLRPGLRVVLGGRTALEVTRVILPDAVPAVTGPGLSPTPIASVMSLWAEPLRLAPGFVPEASAWVWVRDGALLWRYADRDEPTVLGVGDRFTCGASELEVVALPLGALSRSPTESSASGSPSLVVAIHYETVQILVGDHLACVLDGIPARITSEVGLMGGPVAWQVVAREIWRQIDDEAMLRERWDSSLGRLRARLKQARIRTDLVRSTRGGQVELFLLPGDRLDDHS